MTNPAEWPAGLAYAGVFAAAAIEGEIVFVAAAVLAGLGRLNFSGVLIAGALGGSLGDQFYFYALRGRPCSWLSRLVKRIPRHDVAAQRIHRHSTAMILACRFLPGLRVLIPASCAYAGVPAARFSALSLVGSFAWASSILFVIAYAGSEAITFKAWWTPIVPAALFIGFLYLLGRASKQHLERPPQAGNEPA